jgi:hypothetical protein
MPDRKPPRLAGEERETLLTLLQYQRDSFIGKALGVTDEQASWSPVGSGTSLLWLVNHLGDAETVWVLHRFAGLEPAPDGHDHATTIRAAVERYRAISARVDGIVRGAPSLDECAPEFDDLGRANLRWIVSHLLEETARHAGHADILRELVDGAAGMRLGGDAMVPQRSRQAVEERRNRIESDAARYLT